MNAQNTPHSPRTASRQATMREFVAVVFRRRWLILGLFFVVTATVLTLSLTQPTTYSSSGRVLVIRGERPSALSPQIQILNDWEEDLASEEASAQSQPVVARARDLLAQKAKRTGRAAPDVDPKAIDVEVMGKSNVLAIGYTDLDPNVAHDVCDALLTAYLDYRQASKVGKPESYFQSQLGGLDAQIQRKMNEREAVAASSGISNPTDQSRDWDSQLNVLEQHRSETASDLAEMQSSLNSMRELQSHADIDLPTFNGLGFSNEAALVALKQKIVEQQTRIAQLREQYQDDAPEVQNALGTLESLQALLRKEVEVRLTVSQSRVQMLKARLAIQDHDIAELRTRMASMPVNQRKLDALDAEVKTLRARYDEYAKARDQASITANTSQGVSVVLLNPAGPATARNARDYVRLALAPAFSLVVGIGLAFFIDGLDITVRTASQAEEYLEIPVLASLSDRRSRRG